MMSDIWGSGQPSRFKGMITGIEETAVFCRLLFTDQRRRENAGPEILFLPHLSHALRIDFFLRTK
jgi:hypothetical protein